MTAGLTLPGLEVPPLSLRLNVNLWGLDVSTRRVSLGVIQARGPDTAPEVGWFSHEIEQGDGWQDRMARLHDALPAFFGKVARVAPPAGVLAEQPYGQGKARPHPQSYYVLGVVLCALALDFRDQAVVEVIEPSTWKKEALGEGHGFAKKPEILAWAQNTVAYPGDCPRCHGQGKSCDYACKAHDEADCLGAATAAAIRWASGRALR